MVDRLLQYLKESYERLQNRQKGMGDENAGKKGKKGRGGREKEGKGEGKRQVWKGGHLKSEEIRTCNKLHPPFHPSLHLHPSINQPTAKACCLLHFPSFRKATFLCGAGTAGLTHSPPPHSPTHPLPHSLNSYGTCSRIGWLGG